MVLRELRICHRDIKPDNICYNPSKRSQAITIIDYGLAVGFDHTAAAGSNTYKPFEAYSKSGSGAANPGQYKDAETPYRTRWATDAFAFGIVMIETLIGHGMFLYKWKRILKTLQFVSTHTQ